MAAVRGKGMAETGRSLGRALVQGITGLEPGADAALHNLDVVVALGGQHTGRLVALPSGLADAVEDREPILRHLGDSPLQLVEWQ